MCYAYDVGADGCEYVVARYDPPGKSSVISMIHRL